MPGTDYSFELCVEPCARSFARLLCIVDLYSIGLPPGESSSLWMDVMKELFCSIQRHLSSMAIQAFFKSSQADPVCSFILLDLANVPPPFDRFVLFFTLRHRLRAPLSAACLAGSQHYLSNTTLE